MRLRVLCVLGALALALPALVCPAQAQVGGDVPSSPGLLPNGTNATTPFSIGSLFTLDPAASNTTTGNAPILFTPSMSDAHTVGVFVLPTIGSFTGNHSASAYNLKWGDDGSGSHPPPVPAGTAMFVHGYEANITSAQTAADTPGDTGHAFGATIALTGGANIDGIDITTSINTVAANTSGFNFHLSNNVAGAAQYGLLLTSDGTQNGTSALKIPVGLAKWNHGSDWGGTNQIGITTLSFATTAGVTTDYNITGSAAGTLSIQGGGTSGGMILYGALASGGTYGSVRYRNNPVDNTQEASIDLGTGLATFLGGIAPAGGFTSSPRNINTCDLGPNSATSAYTAQTPVITEVYYAEVFVPANVTVTGVALFNSATISGNVKVGLANSSGTNVATSASTAMAGTSAYQRVPFTGTYAAVGPATYYIEAFYDNTTVRPNTLTAGSCVANKQTGQTYATGFTAITPGTTFATALGPVASLY